MDEAVEGAVEDGLGVPDLVVGAVILHELVGVEHVRPDLTPESDVLRRPPLPRELGLALLLLELREPRAEEPHRRPLVRELRALVLALDDDPGREVRYTDGRVGLVHVLASRPARTVGVDPDVGLVDLDRRVLREQRRDDDLRERRVPPVRRVERRQPDEPVHAALGLQDPVRVLAAHLDGRRLEAGLLPGLASSTSVPNPRSAAQRRYMRRSISAQSCASVPPVPAWISRIASPAS